MTSAQNPSALTAKDDAAKKAALDLNIAKVAGGALAAVTTAFSASFLGVSGTISGAAFGSVVSSVAAAIYASSLQTAGSKIKTTTSVVFRPSVNPSTGATDDPDDPTTVPAELSGRSLELPGETEVFPAVEYRRDPRLPGSVTTGGGRPDRRRFAKPAAIFAAFTFLIALSVISLTELAIGHPVGNSKETGVTVVDAFGGGHARSTPTSTATPSSSPTSSTQSPSSSDSGSPSTGAGTAAQSGDSGLPGVTPSDSGGTGSAPTPTGSPQLLNGGSSAGAGGGGASGAPTG
jgi:hypothetical protein